MLSYYLGIYDNRIRFEAMFYATPVGKAVSSVDGRSASDALDLHYKYLGDFIRFRVSQNENIYKVSYFMQFHEMSIFIYIIFLGILCNASSSFF